MATYTLTFACIYSTEFIHRQAFDRAFFAWYNNRTPENEAALEKERHINDMIRFRNSTVGAAILVAVGYGLWGVFLVVEKKIRQAGRAA
jgi:hypothetical protein